MPSVATVYRRAADVVTDVDTRRLAHYRVAEMSYRRRDYAGTVREMQAFIDRYRNDGGIWSAPWPRSTMNRYP